MASEQLDERPGRPFLKPTNNGSSKCCRTKQPAVVGLFESRNCQFEFILHQRVVREAIGSALNREHIVLRTAYREITPEAGVSAVCEYSV